MVARPQAEQKSRKASCRCKRFESIAVEDSEMNLNGYHTPAICFFLRTCVPLLRVGVGVFATPTRDAIIIEGCAIMQNRNALPARGFTAIIES